MVEGAGICRINAIASTEDSASRYRKEEGQITHSLGLAIFTHLASLINGAALDRRDKMQTRWGVVILSADLEWRRSLARILAGIGIDFAYASNVEDCKEIIARENIGLIFWDSHLANGTYRDLALSVRLIDPRVNIVVISYMNNWDERVETAQMGAFGVIPFPCQPTDIEWVLCRAVRAEFVEARSERLSQLQSHVHN